MFLLFSITIFSITSPEEALILFKKATIAWMNNDTLKALEYMKLAMEGEIYFEDIPEFWYMLSRIELELGMMKEAEEALTNVLILDPKRSEIVTLLNTIDIFKGDLEKENPLSYVELFESFDGFLNGYEYFYSPVSVDSYGSELIVLDEANSRLVFLRKGHYKVYKLPVDRPRSLKVDPMLHVVYYTDTKSGTVRKFSLSNFEDEGVLIKDLNCPIVFDVDKAGRLLIGDYGKGKLYLFSPFGKKISEFSIDEDYSISIFNCAAFNYEDIYVQNLSSKSYEIFNTLTNEKVDEIPFPKINALPVTFDVDEYGGIISLWSDGKLRYLLPKTKPIEFSLDFDTSGINFIRYAFPFLICSDIKKHKIYKLLLNTEKANYFVSISSFKIDGNIMTVDFSVENLLDETKALDVSPFLYVFDSKGRVGFDYVETTKGSSLTVVEDLKFFLENQINHVLRNRKNYVLLKSSNDISNVELSRVLMQSKFKDLTFYLVMNDKKMPTGSVLTLVHATGGLVISSEYLEDLKKYLSTATSLTSRVRYIQDFSTKKIRSISIQLKIGGHIYSDTVYYIGGLNIEESAGKK